MQNMNQPSDSVASTILDVFYESETQERKSKEKQASKRRLQARRAIEDYLENKRLREATEDYYLSK
ncbi:MULTISPECIES: PA3496 family putative envelope integrity protein [unclassified Hahella]|uniref:PA3496 family putative envelope integrity protein n=1 Tax=unclassified Hahella TaxID=2624107 RepID=UPI000FDF126F|nr:MULTISPECIES: hypothetical protein [unclassified Hahella]AZZ90204.1 hypothetical protein ENC22_02985 [Hahella sp. KA22]MBU6954712.1 hypothetical protein [Hahella sp. HN01]MDG9668893.1 hypothetical protein [Hahella sp. CR1]QAY53574.1 hypothetical protein EUZ85_05535 [Hahella sp. KA22]